MVLQNSYKLTRSCECVCICCKTVKYVESQNVNVGVREKENLRKLQVGGVSLMRSDSSLCRQKFDQPDPKI